MVLGSSGAWPERGRACSGYVLEHQGVRIVMDLGYGTASRLLDMLGSSVGDGIDAVVVTHEHPDHMVDLHALFRARWFGRRGAPAIPLFSPEEVVDRLKALEEDEGDAVHDVFDWHALPAKPYRVGPFRLESRALPHFVPNAGVRLIAERLVVAYTGDTGPDAALTELGRDADLYVVEASDRDDAPRSYPGPRKHLTAEEAGAAASEAGARRLLLSHFWPDKDREASRIAAGSTYDGEIFVAEEGLVVDLP